jgi:centriolar protein POC1
MLLTGSDDKSIKVWNVKTRKFKGRDKLVSKFKTSILGHTNWIRSAQFSPDARIIVSGSDDKSVKIWDVANKKNLMSFTDHTEIVRDVKFHPDGTCVASCSDDSKIKLWDLRSKRLLQHYDAHDAAINKISFHPNGKYLVSASDDSTAKIWDVRMGNILFTLYGHDGPVTAINFSECGDFFATGGEDTIVNIWKSNLDSNGEVDTLEDLTGLISIGGLREPSLRSNVETYLVPESDKVPSQLHQSPSKARLNTQASASSRIGFPGLGGMKSDRTKSDMTGIKTQFEDMNRSPEAEFYKQPARFECIPDTAFSKTNIDKVPHEISSTVSKIVNQLDLLSNTLELLNQRVSSNESQAKEALQFFKDLNQRDNERTETLQKAHEKYQQMHTPQ